MERDGLHRIQLMSSSLALHNPSLYWTTGYSPRDAARTLHVAASSTTGDMRTKSLVQPLQGSLQLSGPRASHSVSPAGH